MPNDFSEFQSVLLKSKKVKKKYWVAFPDHLNYFTAKSLSSLCEAKGWVTHKIISDFPIEWFLTNNYSNYVEKQKTGKEAHLSRVFIENFLLKTNNINNLIDFYEALAKIGQGRQLIAFFKNT